VDDLIDLPRETGPVLEAGKRQKQLHGHQRHLRVRYFLPHHEDNEFADLFLLAGNHLDSLSIKVIVWTSQQNRFDEQIQLTHDGKNEW
jgi:hypothetical protein